MRPSRDMTDVLWLILAYGTVLVLAVLSSRFFLPDRQREAPPAEAQEQSAEDTWLEELATNPPAPMPRAYIPESLRSQSLSTVVEFTGHRYLHTTAEVTEYADGTLRVGDYVWPRDAWVSWRTGPYGKDY